MAGWLAKMRKRGLWARVGLLSLVVFLGFFAISPLVGWLQGKIGLLAAGVAAGVCLLAGGVTLGVCSLFRTPGTQWIGVMAGMIPRMAIPLEFALLFRWWQGPLTEAGVIHYLVAFYLLTLAVETMLSLPEIEVQKPSRGTKDSKV